MADNSNITVDCSAVIDMLKNLEGEVALKAMKKALRAGGKVEQAEIRANCPTKISDGPGGNSLPQGALKSDVIIQSGMDEGTPYVAVTFGKYSKHVARFIEDGHKIVHGGKDGKQDTGKETEPNPFVSRAFEAAEQSVHDAISETLISEIVKASEK